MDETTEAAPAVSVAEPVAPVAAEGVAAMEAPDLEVIVKAQRTALINQAKVIQELWSAVEELQDELLIVSQELQRHWGGSFGVVHKRLSGKWGDDGK